MADQVNNNRYEQFLTGMANLGDNLDDFESAASDTTTESITSNEDLSSPDTEDGVELANSTEDLASPITEDGSVLNNLEVELGSEEKFAESPEKAVEIIEEDDMVGPAGLSNIKQGG
jgi:hypothetical protein